MSLETPAVLLVEEAGGEEAIREYTGRKPFGRGYDSITGEEPVAFAAFDIAGLPDYLLLACFEVLFARGLFYVYQGRQGLRRIVWMFAASGLLEDPNALVGVVVTPGQGLRNPSVELKEVGNGEEAT